MRHLFTITLMLISISMHSQSLLYSTQVGDLHVGFNKNAELLGFAYFLGFESMGIESDTISVNGTPIAKKDWHAYGYAFSRKYQNHLNSEQLQKAFALADHLWLNTLLDLLLQLEDVPNARIHEGLDPSAYIAFSKSRDPQEALRNVTQFLEGFNAFSREVDFDTYLQEWRPYYEKAMEEISGNLPTTDFIPAMEHYFDRSFSSYTLIPSLTIPKGMGFGLNLGNSGVFNIFGALDYQNIAEKDSLVMGFANEQELRELSIHEFGHSFVNPIFARLPEASITKTAALFEPIREAIYQQGYNTWGACLNEHFVRSAELYLSELYDTPEAYQDLYREYVESRQFIYVPLILEELKESARAGRTFEDAVTRSMNRLSEKMGGMQR